MLLREELLLLALLREAVAPLLREGLDTEALLLLGELLLRDTLPLYELFEETEAALFLDEVLLPLPLLRDTPVLEVLLLRDTLFVEALLRDADTEADVLRDVEAEVLRDALDELRVSLDELREEGVEPTAVRRFSSESTFTTRLFLSREGTFTNPDLRSRLLFS